MELITGIVALRTSCLADISLYREEVLSPSCRCSCHSRGNFLSLNDGDYCDSRLYQRGILVNVKAQLSLAQSVVIIKKWAGFELVYPDDRDQGMAYRAGEQRARGVGRLLAATVIIIIIIIIIISGSTVAM